MTENLFKYQTISSTQAEWPQFCSMWLLNFQKFLIIVWCINNWWYWFLLLCYIWWCCFNCWPLKQKYLQSIIWWIWRIQSRLKLKTRYKKDSLFKYNYSWCGSKTLDWTILWWDCFIDSSRSRNYPGAFSYSVMLPFLCAKSLVIANFCGNCHIIKYHRFGTVSV